MAVEVIEGSLHPAERSGGNRKYARYKALQITVPNGEVRPLGKVAAGGRMIEEIRRGGPGRYYLAHVGGAQALIGVRRSDGSAVYAHYQNLETVFLVVGVMGLLGGIAKYGFGLETFPLTPVVLGPVLIAIALYMRNQRLRQQREFEADAT